MQLRPDATPPSDLGLPASGETVTTPLRPLEIRLLGPEGAFILDAVDSFTVWSENDHTVAVEATYAGNGEYGEAFALLERLGPNFGWTDADLTQLESDLVVDQRTTQGDRYSARIGPADAIGAHVSATISVDLTASGTELIFRVAVEAP
jgi:hypothetical protein